MAVGFDGGDDLFCGRTLDDGDELGSNDDSVGFLPDFDEVLLGRNSESDGKGDFGREEGTDTSEEGREGRGDGGRGSGGPHFGDDVDEGIGDGGEEFDSCVGRGGGDEGDVGHSVKKMQR